MVRLEPWVAMRDALEMHFGKSRSSGVYKHDLIPYSGSSEALPNSRKDRAVLLW